MSIADDKRALVGGGATNSVAKEADVFVPWVGPSDSTATSSTASDAISEVSSLDGFEEVQPVAVQLRGAVQHYAWGRPKSSSLVAAMAGCDARAAHRECFAELWLGTHPNGHACVLMPGAEGAQEGFLKELIDRNPAHWLGDCSRGSDIPYLLKVLSVNKALSIQAHPNKRLAEQLHRRSPEHYPDDNHKPEICIPMGHFEALCGFRPVAEVRTHVRDVGELRALCCAGGDPGARSLKELFSNLMRSAPASVEQQVGALVRRLEAAGRPHSPEEQLVLRLARDYPGDVGVFAVYFLNYVRVTPEEPHRYIYCAPDEPHAYLSGDAVECMAISDNVVRAGLTSKHKDVDTLLGMLTYRDDLLDTLVGVGERVSPALVKYDPPVEDFMVYEVMGSVPEGVHLPHASIITCTDGAFSVTFKSGGVTEAPQRVVRGDTFFSRAGTELAITAMEGQGRLFVATF